MSFPCVFAVIAATINVSHGAFSAPHPALISCGGLLWDREREKAIIRQTESRALHLLCLDLYTPLLRKEYIRTMLRGSNNLGIFAVVIFL